ncbi:MAG: hypothetical protein AAGI01_09185 [Myxococcota bacterium]
MKGRTENMAHRRTTILAGVAATLMACTPGTADVDPSSNRFLIYNYDRMAGTYQLEPVQIATIRDVRSADGELFNILGGGSLATPIADPQTEDEWRRSLVVEGATPPTIEYTIDSDGTVIPWDFDSAMMLTVYHHLEQAAQYFDTIPLDGIEGPNGPLRTGEFSRQVVGKVPCYYYPQIELGGLPLPLFTDNAAYAFTLNAFLVPPRFSATDAVPIYANRGVMTHEYSHAVFNRLVHNSNPVPDYILNADNWEDVSVNELRGLDEGAADIFAYLDVADPNFIAPSITVDIGRDMSVAKFYDEEMLAVFSGTSAGATDEATPQAPVHDLGAVIAAMFFQLQQDTAGTLTEDELATVMVRSLRAINDPRPGWRLVEFLDVFHDELPEEVRAGACALLAERFPSLAGELACLL